MQEVTARYAVGLDIGTTTIRCVIGLIDPSNPSPSIVGVGEKPTKGLRKGTIVNLMDVAQAADTALEAAERLSGHDIHEATVNINGTHVLSMNSKGVIAVGAGGHEITKEDVARVEEAATVLQLPPNREILQVTPRSYSLDGQENIKDPIGMHGVRLEVDAHVITALSPHVRNLEKTMEMTHTGIHSLMVSSLAASRAILNEQQIENGVVLADIGGSTTNIAVFEEGDLLHLAILPYGGINITNDLAIGLKTDLDIAEKVKLEAINLVKEKNRPKEFSFEHNKKEYSFKMKDIDEIVEARLEEIFEAIDGELKKINRSKKLPGGMVIVGGTANITGIAEFAKKILQLPARISEPNDISGLIDKVSKPEFATAVGLMLEDFQKNDNNKSKKKSSQHFSSSAKNTQDLFKRISSYFTKFKS